MRIRTSSPVHHEHPRRRSRTGDVITPVHAVLRLASLIEPDPLALASWFYTDPILELGGNTAEMLVRNGQGWSVLCFLQKVRRRICIS